MSRTLAFISVAFAIATFMVFTSSTATAAEPTGELDAAIIGSAEFVPGIATTVQISIQNNKTVGEIENIARQAGLANYYGLAVGVTAILQKGNAPITIKTDKVLLGNISSGETTSPISFMIEVDKDAVPASYQMFLELTYQELSGITIGETVNLQWANKTVSKELKIEIIEIKEELPGIASAGELDAAIVGSAEFAPGTTNVVQISIQNNKTISEQDARAIQADLSNYYGSAVSITASLKEGNAPVTIKTDKALLGTIPAGVATPPIPFITEVKSNALPGSYQMVLELTYKELSDIKIGEKVNLRWADKTISTKLNIQIKEEPLAFEVTNIEAALWPGARKEIRLTFKNSGRQAARSAVAKITATDPLSPTDDTSFLDDLEPGDTVIGIFGLKVKGDAIPKEYAIDAQIKYTDYQGKEHISKVLKVPVSINSGSSPIYETIRNYLPGVLVGAGIVAAIWIIWFIWFRVKPIVID